MHRFAAAKHGCTRQEDGEDDRRVMICPFFREQMEMMMNDDEKLMCW